MSNKCQDWWAGKPCSFKIIVRGSSTQIIKVIKKIRFGSHAWRVTAPSQCMAPSNNPFIRGRVNSVLAMLTLNALRELEEFILAEKQKKFQLDILCTYAFIEILTYHWAMKSWNVKVLWGRNIPSNRFYWVLVRSEWQLVVGAVKLESPGRNHNRASSPIPAGHKLVGNVTGCSRATQISDMWKQGASTMGLPLPSLVFSLFSHRRYDSLSDVPESRVCFASENLTPCRMHWNDFLIAQIIAKCHSFPNMYDIL